MANKRAHIGIIRHTVPEPTVFYGCSAECAEKMGITIRALNYLRSGVNKINKQGWKVMTEEEYAKYYQPPRPYKLPDKKPGSNERKYWKLLILKDWKAGELYPKEKERVFSGTIVEFSKRIGCQVGQVHRMVNAYLGILDDYPLRSLRGWRIARLRKYTGDEVRTKRVWCKEQKKMVYVKQTIRGS
jgi:hypothetical protein